MTLVQVRAAVNALALLSAVELALRATSFTTVARWCGAQVTSGEHALMSEPDAPVLSEPQRARLRAIASAARRWPLGPPGGCLRHCLAAAYVLRRHGPYIRLSVSTDSESVLRAHAWLEIAGAAITDPAASGFQLRQPPRACPGGDID